MKFGQLALHPRRRRVGCVDGLCGGSCTSVRALSKQTNKQTNKQTSAPVLSVQHMQLPSESTLPSPLQVFSSLNSSHFDPNPMELLQQLHPYVSETVPENGLIRHVCVIRCVMFPFSPQKKKQEMDEGSREYIDARPTRDRRGTKVNCTSLLRTHNTQARPSLVSFYSPRPLQWLSLVGPLRRNLFLL